MKGLILCGGKGTRLRPYSYSRPKHLLPVANQPVIQFAIDKMRKIGIREIGIVVPPHFQVFFESVLGHGEKEGPLQYIEQHEPKGLADAVRSAKSFIGNDPFLLFLGDNFYAGELDILVNRFEPEKTEALLMVSHVKNPTQFGVVHFEGSKVIRVVEKPKNPPSSFAIVGIYMFTPKIFDVIEQLSPSDRGEYEITDAIQSLVDRGCTVQAVSTDSWWRDTGQPQDMLACNRHVLLGLQGDHYEPDVIIESSTIEGHVIFKSGVHVINSVIRGPVTIGAGSYIKGSYIGPFTSIGPDVCIEYSEIENSIVLERTHISKITRRIDESIIGSEVRLEGINGYPSTMKVNIGDHSKVYLHHDD